MGKVEVSDMKQHLRKNHLFLGRGTVENGLTHILHEACRTGHGELVKYLLKSVTNDIDINAPVKYHPLSYRYFTSEEQMTLNEKLDHYNGTLMHAAAEGGSVPVIKHLISVGASVNSVNCCSESPLIVALVHRQAKAALLLIESGAKVDYQTSEGMTPLMYAVTTPSMVHVIAPLIEAGSNVRLTDSCGYTALHRAFLAGTMRSVNVLLSLGVPPTLSGECLARSPAYLGDHLLFIRKTLYEHSQYRNILVNVIQPHFTTSVQIDTYLLKATFHFARFCEEGLADWIASGFLQACWLALADGLNLQSEVARISSEMPIAAYGDRVEVCSWEEVQQLRYMPSVLGHQELAYQCLLIRERCLGFGDTTVIDLLLKVGKMFFTRQQQHKALLLWVRASEMAHHCLTEKGLYQIRELPLKEILEHLTLCTRGVGLGQILSDQKSSDQLALFISTCIDNTAEHILLTRTKWHFHQAVSVTSSTEIVNSLVIIFGHLISNQQLKVTKSIDIDSLGEKFVKGCKGPIVTYTGWSTSLLLLAHQHFFASEVHMRQLLEWGAHEYVNDPGESGNRLLHIVQLPSIVSLVLEYGAHPDAVNMHGKSPPFFAQRSYQDPQMLALFEFPRPLVCLSASVVVETGIPYQSLPLPQRIKTLISYHDPTCVVPETNSVLC